MSFEILSDESELEPKDKVITLRLTKAEHASIRTASYLTKQSMNRFCLDAVLAKVKIVKEEIEMERNNQILSNP